jgi:hypothetical protein
VSAKDDLDGFVREGLNRGLSRDELEAVLRGAGWAEAQVTGALSRFADVDFPIAVPRPRASLSARETFEYLVLFGTLYFSAFNLGLLLFQFIDLAFPDPLWSPMRYEMVMRTIRWAISVLVVSTPVFLLMAWANRRWLSYVTLAVAASVLIGDCTALVYNLLGGETTARFLLKALIIGVIAGTAFGYYLSDLRRSEEEVGT